MKRNESSGVPLGDYEAGSDAAVPLESEDEASMRAGPPASLFCCRGCSNYSMTPTTPEPTDIGASPPRLAQSEVPIKITNTYGTAARGQECVALR